MDQTGLLRCIAEAGYNVGFGAKKNFATFDIVEKGPGWIGFLSLAIGTFALVFEELSRKVPSAMLVVAGIIALYISFYRSSEYDEAGRELTGIFKELRDLYWSVKSGANVDESHAELRRLEDRSHAVGLSKQILLSDWYAHYKFFTQQQIGWIDEQLHFTWRDKFPVSARIAVGFAITTVVTAGIYLLIRGG